MADVPTREELYETVDQLYHEEHPAAPYTIDPSQPGHEQWRDVWLAIRDRVLNQEVNRIYWDTFPYAPVKLDPDDRDHAEYIAAWNDIRARVLANQPMPPTERADRQADLDAGLSYIRSAIYEDFAEMLKASPSTIKDQIEAWADPLVNETMRALRDGSIVAGEEWTGNTQKVSTEDTPPVTMSFNPFASVTDGEVHAGVRFELDDPNIEIEYDDEPQPEEP
jgi:hypothetical protein